VPRDDLSRQLSQLESFLAHVASLGDDLHVVRPVDHTALFRLKSRAQAAATELAAAGYQVEVHREGFRWEVEATKASAIDRESASAFLREVIPMVNRHGGVYDGWGSFQA
jgi:hypothetical protein